MPSRMPPRRLSGPEEVITVPSSPRERGRSESMHPNPHHQYHQTPPPPPPPPQQQQQQPSPGGDLPEDGSTKFSRVDNRRSFYPADDDDSTQPGAVSVIGGGSVGDISLTAKENYKTLLMACGKKRVDAHYVKDLVELCNSDADKLQRELEAKLMDESASDKIVSLLDVISEINDAIETGKRALRRVKDAPSNSAPTPSSSATSRTGKPQADGPTIELLVQNEDVFSLTCMLRAGSEKRLAAALALMRFAKNSDMLRDEIRSLGGMHSFLTLFRSNGMTREIQVVASMAVAYLLPSFVASSQTSSSLGLKILECLRFLLISRPVHPQGKTIGRDEMCQACAYGLNILWIHAIQPLLASEMAKTSKREKRPSQRITASRSLRKLQNRRGSGMFDPAQGQAQSAVEIKELTELAVTMITHIAKLTNGEKLNIDMGFNIVEQICEVDVARPIAVREGLLKILVDWIRSNDFERVRPAASALRYLISIKDLYMAGWIHSQVVNEGAVVEIVKLLENPLGHDVRVAVAQMLSALCVAPHTRAAVVEARCVSYLVAMLYEHIDPASEQMVQYASSALLQLAAGAMTRSGGGLTGSSLAMIDSGSSDNQEAVVK
jgi:predicted house-cleaning noncanonical NTP pyrophosphatase (MazG superfamily)